jgi:Ca-activated chloride channel family protein
VKFLWPEALWLLLAVPLVAAAYVYALRRRTTAAARFPGLAAAAGHPTPRFFRHAPPLLFLIAIATMIVAIARPVAVVMLPSQHQAVVLAIDVSGSMRATDVKPNRLAAAQAAARKFIDEQPRSTRIGVVAFAASASAVQHPTHDRDAVRAALDRLGTQPGTALGSGIVVALGSLFPGQGITVEAVQQAAAERKDRPREPKPLDGGEDVGKTTAAESQGSAAIIVLTDGQANTGVPPLDAARAAAERNVRVFTIGTGTPAGETLTVDGWRMRVRLDEDTLKQVADVTRGRYFHAGNEKDLEQVYTNLNTRFLMQKKETEITAIFSGVAVLVAMVSALLSFAWFGRIV